MPTIRYYFEYFKHITLTEAHNSNVNIILTIPLKI